MERSAGHGGPAGDRARYHHGDLRRGLFRALADEVLHVGPAAVSLRAVARSAGVSHAAPVHHFGDKRGLLTAFAAEGHRMLAAGLDAAAAASGGDFTAVGLAYVGFALDHRAHFEVMFRPELLRRDDPDLVREATASSAALRRGAAGLAPGADEDVAMVAAWSLVHGFASLWLGGNLPERLGPPRDLARRVAAAVELAPPERAAGP